jgi:hypothetical protein
MVTHEVFGNVHGTVGQFTSGGGSGTAPDSGGGTQPDGQNAGVVVFVIGKGTVPGSTRPSRGAQPIML